MESTKLRVYDADLENKPSAVHILPCKIDYDGPAKVDSFFIIDKLSERDPEADPKILVSAFRGRRLLGETFPIPEGCDGYIVAENFDYDDDANDADSEAELDGDPNAGGAKRFFQVEGTFNSITHWQQDAMPSRVDGSIPGLMNFIELSRVLHGPME